MSDQTQSLRLNHVLTELDRTYTAIERSLDSLFSSRSTDSEAFPVELQVISGRIQGLQPQYLEAVAIWTSDQFRPTTENVKLRKKVQEVLERVLRRIEEQQRIAESVKTKLMPELNSQAMSHRAQSAYRRTSRTS